MLVIFLQLARSLWHLEQGIESGTGRSMETMALLVPVTPMILPSPFFVMPYDNGHHPHEFHIAYMGDNGTSRRLSAVTQKAIPRYLDADVSLFGTNSGPLHLVYHVSERSRLLLYGRIANEKGPISPSTWTQGNDMFFINCARRRMKRDGYIAMRRHRRNGEIEWVSACFPTRSSHNDRRRFMLFRLLPASLRDDPGLLPAEPDNKAGPTGFGEPPNPFEDLDASESLDERLKRYGRGSVPEAFRALPSPLLSRSVRKEPVSPSDSERNTLTVPELTDLHFPLVGPGHPAAEATSRV
jgi:hypothetical protein